ncbi:MAG: TIR domain-containing protein [Candidatus Paceibacterota bacterium]|jgi:hypothetical protein
MAYKNKTYVAFDGDNDIKSYYLMKAWKENKHIDFDFYDAHELNSARDTSTEESIKAQLRERMKNAKQMILLVGENTKYLRKFVPWEIDFARKNNIPIIVVNLNNKRGYDDGLCPSSIKDNVYTISVSFNAAIIKYALDDFPEDYQNNKDKESCKSHRFSYKDSVYEKLGL